MIQRAPILLTALLAASALLLAGCTPGDGGATPAPSRKALTLSIGTLLPQTGALAQFGPAAEAGVALAVKEVNDAKVGITVASQSKDSGDATTDTAVAAADELVTAGVSVIVGAISDNVSRKVIDKIVGAGVVEISPGNTSTDFSRYADKGLYWRTAPSCAREGTAMGERIAADGAKTLGVIYQTGFCDPGLLEAVTGGFERSGGKVVASTVFDAAATSLTAQVAEVVAAKPDAVVIVTPTGAHLAVPDLATAGYKGSQLYFVGLSIGDHSADFPAGSLTGATASMPGIDISSLKDFTDRLLEVSPGLTDFSYAAESYDAVILSALAALAANGTSGKAIASKLQEVSGGSGGGTVATDFASAARIILDGGVVDYDGPSGPISFDDNGDPADAVIGIYQYRADNTFVRID